MIVTYACCSCKNKFTTCSASPSKTAVCPACYTLASLVETTLRDLVKKSDTPEDLLRRIQEELEND